jgi:hemolysin III
MVQCRITLSAGAAMTVAALPHYRRGDEFASSLLHGLGIVLSIAGLAVLVAFAALRGDARAVVACAVYGVTLVLLYTASTLYHAIPVVAAKPLLRTLDHIAIYLLIAGTYTPFTLIALPGAWGWSLFAAVWTLALIGSVLELGWFRRWHKLAVLLYVGMGWIGMLAFKPLATHLQAGGMALLIGGGVAYTLGVPFYLWRKLPYQHTLWHAFVLAGSVLHYFAVLLYVLPGAA